MTVLRVLSLICFLVLSGVVLFEDLAFRKIRNRHLAFGAALVFGGYGLQILLTLLGTGGFVEKFLIPEFYGAALLNVAVALGAAVSLWLLDIWPAGDAKLFTLCAAFVPLIIPEHRAFPRYLFLQMMVNIFVLSSFFILGGLAAGAIKKFFDGSHRAAMAGSLKRMIRAAPETLKGWAVHWRAIIPFVLTLGPMFLAQSLLRQRIGDLQQLQPIGAYACLGHVSLPPIYLFIGPATSRSPGSISMLLRRKVGLEALHVDDELRLADEREGKADHHRLGLAF